MRGFTFVELLLAATMLSVLFVGLGAHLRSGVLVWHKTSTALEALQRHRVALDRLGNDVANAVLFADAAVDAPLPVQEFGQTELRLLSAARGYGPRAPSLRYVTYRCGDEEAGTGLWRTSLTLAQARMNETPEPQRLLEGCTELRLRYGYAGAEGIEWRDGWPSPDQLPQLIEAELAFGEAAPLRHVLTIPSGTLQPAEGP